MNLEFIEFLEGVFTAIFVVISVIVGIKILFKSYEHKNKDLILVGLACMGLVSPWFGDFLNLIFILLLNTTISEWLYLIFVIAFLPIFLLCWLTAFTNLLYKEKQKLILVLYLAVSVFFEIFFWYFLITSNIDKIGTFTGPFHIDYTLFFEIYFIFCLGFFVITGMLLAREFLTRENAEFKLKGKFLIVAFIFVAIGASLDIAFPLVPITIVITRIILSTSAICFYIGFILPNWMKKIFLTS